MTKEFSAQAALAQKEYNLIQDLLRTPLREDLSGQALPEHRRWIGGCLKMDLPDLIPLNPGMCPNDFCVLEYDSIDPSSSTKYLKVTVKNQGTAIAKESKMKVVFKPKDPGLTTPDVVVVDIPQIPPAETKSVRVNFNQAFLVSGFNFEIFVNSEYNVKESNVENNYAYGCCSSDYEIYLKSREQV